MRHSSQEEAVIDLETFLAARGEGLLRFAYLLTQDRGRAEDLVQEALTRSYRKLPDVAHPEAYLRRSILNMHISLRRRRSWGEVAVAVPDAPVPPHESDALWRLLGQLPRRQHAVLVLRYYEDMSDADIAEVLGCAAGTVRSLASRAMATLRADPAIAELARG